VTTVDDAQEVTRVVAPVLVAGEEVPSDFAPVLNPARTSEVVGEYALGTAHHIDLAAAAALAAFPLWSALSARERAEYMLRAADLIDVGLADRAVLLTREQGKVLWESKLDVGGAPMMLRYFAGLAEETERLGEAAVPTVHGNAVLRHVPVGPVGIISPWNTPVYLAFGAIAPALIAGNTVVVKLPEDVPLALSETLRLLAEALPSGVISAVPGVGEVAGAALAMHPDIRHLLFTGSIETGKSVMRGASMNLKTLGMELGGNDPAIVLGDTKITDSLLSEFMAGVFSSSGQICFNIKRIYVEQSIYREFVDAFTESASRIVVGNGLDPRSTIGPLTTKVGFDRLVALRDSAESRGATVTRVGHKLDASSWDDGYYMLPTIVTSIDAREELVTGEQFGPVIPILPFSDVEAAIREANDSEYGLAASVWSSDVHRARDVARRVQAGNVFINVHRVGASPMEVPFGGMKQSGMGRNHGLRAVKDSMEEQAIIDFEDTSHMPGAREWQECGLDDHASLESPAG
jgi:aldehyde dehydrogenase